MNKRQQEYKFITTIVKISALIGCFYSFNGIVIHVFTGLRTQADPWPWVLLIPFIVMFIASLVFFFFPSMMVGNLAISKLQLKEEEKQLDELNLSFLDIAILAKLIVGFYYLLQSILDASYVVAAWTMGKVIREQYHIPWVWSEKILSYAIYAVTEFILAMWLLFGANGLLNLIGWARRFAIVRYKAARKNRR